MGNNLKIGEIYTLEYLLDEIGVFSLDKMVKGGLIFKREVGEYEYYG